MGLVDFTLKCEKDNEQLRQDLKYYKNKNARLKEQLENINECLFQQKEFIKFLEDNWKETQDIWYIKVLNKYKEIIGASDEKN